jgi:two-component system OmpR family sensor kinase
MRRIPGAARVRYVVAATPLRIRLVATVLVLATAGLVLTAVATTAALHSYRVDDQLTNAAVQTAGGPFGRTGSPSRSGDFGPAPGSTRRGAFSQFYVASFDATGTPLGTPFDEVLDSPSPPKLPRLTVTQAAVRHSPFTVSAVHGGSQWRVVTRVLADGSGSVEVAESLSDVNHTVNRLVFIEVAIGIVVLALMAAGGYLLIRRSLRPLVTVESTAAAIAGGDLSRRVPVLPLRTEVGQLSASFNAMLAQIESAFAAERTAQQDARASEDRMRRFVADASHELRTPLTSIRGFAELFRMGGVDPGTELPRVMSRIENEASRMGVLVEDLLLLARLDQQRPLEREPVDLVTVATDAVQDARLVAPRRRIELVVDDRPVVTGDDARLRQVLHNLLTNALTHTPDESPVTVRLAASDEPAPQAVVEVADRGPGIDPADSARVFERFYRADDSRSREAGGSGLGLSIVASIVAAHGGSVTVAQRDGGGAVFRVALPLRAVTVAT